MNGHLYIIRHQFNGEEYIHPCIGEDEMSSYADTAERMGARLVGISDMEFALNVFLFDCCFEGVIKEWTKEFA